MSEDTSAANGRRKVNKLYVGGRAKLMAEQLARAFAGGKQSALSAEELSWLSEAVLEPGSSMVASVVELALAGLLARVRGVPLIDESGCPVDRADRVEHTLRTE